MSKPMVPQGERKPVQLSAAMQRIAQGEAGHDPRGKIAGLNKPEFQLQVPGDYSIDSAYPRHGTVHSLQYHNTLERAGAYKAPGAGRSSILGGELAAHLELFAPAVRVGSPPRTVVKVAKKVASATKASQQSPEQTMLPEQGAGTELAVEDGASPQSALMLTSVAVDAPAVLNQSARMQPLARVEVPASQDADASELSPRGSPYAPVDVPLQHAGPPRSGKSIFYAQGSRPLVPTSARNPVVLTPAMERIARGEAGHDAQGMIPKVHQPSEIAVRQVAYIPPLESFESAYPRHGTVNSLQYHEPVERAGAYMAPGPGRGSVFVPPDLISNQIGMAN